MFGLVRVLKRATFTPGQNVFVQRFYMNAKDAKGSVGAVESVLVMTFITAAVLGPAGWLLTTSSDSARNQ